MTANNEIFDLDFSECDTLNRTENNGNDDNVIPSCGLREQEAEQLADDLMTGTLALARDLTPLVPGCGIVLAILAPLLGLKRWYQRRKRVRKGPFSMKNPLWEAQMMNIDHKFEAAGKNDYMVKDEMLSTEVAKIETRDIVNVISVTNEMITGSYFDDRYRVDAKPFVERPFYVDTVTITNNDARFAYLNNGVKYLPGDVIRSNPSLLNAMKIASLYRSDLTLNISAAGTIGHAGCVLVGVLPPMQNYPSANGQNIINTIMSGPHGFLNFNEATALNLEVPWYCNTDYATLDMDTDPAYSRAVDFTNTNGNYAMLVFVVLNPLVVADGSSTSLDIVVEACFKKLDMFVPTPRYLTWVAQGDLLAGVATGLLDAAAGGIKTLVGDGVDMLREGIRSETGLHNPNVPLLNDKIVTTAKNYYNTVDAAQYFEKMHPFVNGERIVLEPIFGTSKDEMNLSFIQTKKQMLGSFKVATTDPVGTLRWVRPISPFQGGFGPVGADGVAVNNNIELLHSLHMGWRGKIKIHIQSVMNNKQQIKLKLIKYYNPSVKVLTNYPVYKSIVSAPSQLMEFTQGGQEHVVELPFLSRNAIMPCAEDMSMEALLHGLYYIYVAQSLVNADGSPLSCEFNVFISLEPDFQWYGYCVKKLTPRSYFLTGAQPITPVNMFKAPITVRIPDHWKDLTKKEFYTKWLTKDTRAFDKWNPTIAKLKDTDKLDKVTKIRADSSVMPRLKTKVWHAQMRVMNEPQEQRESTGVVNNNSNNSTRMVPNMDLRPTLRRMYRVLSEQVTLPSGATSGALIPLAACIGEEASYPLVSPMLIASRMYYGKSVGFKCSLLLTSLDKDLSDVDVKVHYVTPNMAATVSNETVRKSGVNVLAYPDTFTPGLLDPPVPFLVNPVSRDTNRAVFEFIVPNTTYLKFVGSTDQFLDIGAPSSDLATSDCGSILVSYTNSNATDTITINNELLIGLSDESRLGMHAIAAPFIIDKTNSTYLGDTTSQSAIITNVVNPFVYRGGFAGGV